MGVSVVGGLGAECKGLDCCTFAQARSWPCLALHQSGRQQHLHRHSHQLGLSRVSR